MRKRQPLPIPHKLRLDSHESLLDEIRKLMLGADSRSPNEPEQKAPPEALERQLNERIKELICLHGINQLVFRHGNSLEAIFRGVVKLLPEALQYPHIAVAMLKLGNQTYQSHDQVVLHPNACLKAFFRVDEKEMASISLGYLPDQELSSRPFLQEEKLLLGSVAEHLGLIVQRALAERALEQANLKLKQESRSLFEANAALRALTERLYEEKNIVSEIMKSNLKHSVFPALQRLRTFLPQEKRSQVDLISYWLEDLVSPFLKNLNEHSPDLTPTEQKICLSIRAGLTSKEIAQLRGVSVGTVNRHRENIRRKLGLQGSSKNLVSHLLTIEDLSD